MQPLRVGHSPVPPAARWGTERMLQGRQLCLLNVLPAVSRSLRNLGLSLNSGYSPCSLPTEDLQPLPLLLVVAKPISLLRAWPGAAMVGQGGAGRRSCYGLGALTEREQQAGVQEPVALRIIAVQ